MLQHLRTLEPQLVSAQQQFGKVHQAGAVAGDLIRPIHLQHGPGKQIPGRGIHMRAAQPLVFLCIDVPHGLLGRPAGLIQPQIPAHALDQAQLIITVQYLEILR